MAGDLSKPLVVLPPWGNAAAGALGAVLANTLVYPLDIVKTKLQVQRKRKPAGDEEKGQEEEYVEEYYQGTVDALKKIYLREGISGLYVGLWGCLAGVASTNFAYFYWYGLVRSWYLQKTKSTSPTTGVELLLGAVAGALAQLCTLPVSVVTTRQQTEQESKHRSLIETGKEVIAQDGISGLWRGLKASLILVVNPAITYGVYQRLETVFLKTSPTGRLSPARSFILGATSKSLATIASQPLIIAKVMQQAAGSSKREGQEKVNGFGDALKILYKYEGISGLYKGIGPQLSKGIMVQGLLFMFKDQIQLLIILLFRYFQRRGSSINKV